MGHLGTAAGTVHLISAPDQPGRQRMCHYIRDKLRDYYPNIYTFHRDPQVLGENHVKATKVVWSNKVRLVE